MQVRLTVTEGLNTPTMQIVTADGVQEVPWFQSWRYMTIGAVWAFFQYGAVPVGALIGDTLVRYQGGWQAVDWQQIAEVGVISGAGGAWLYIKGHWNLLKIPPSLVIPDEWKPAQIKTETPHTTRTITTPDGTVTEVKSEHSTVTTTPVVPVIAIPATTAPEVQDLPPGAK